MIHHIIVNCNSFNKAMSVDRRLPEIVSQCCSALRTGAKERSGRLKSPTSTATGLSMLLVTGGAGFIGSNVVASLNEAGRTDIAGNDILGGEGKGGNLAARQI